MRLHFFPETASTNDEARDRKYCHGDVVLAENQLAGRGQRGNGWAGGVGENLTFSLVIEPATLPFEKPFLLSEATAVALVETLGDFGIGAAIKWPNDIYVGERKISGVLIENDLMGDRFTKSVVGIGLNVNQRVFDPSLPNPVSMAQVGGRTFDRTDVFGVLLGRLVARLWGFSEGDLDAAALEKRYFSLLYRGGGVFRYRDVAMDERFEARIERVEPSGELTLVRPDGTRKGFFFKEVEFL
ncbi:MAG: biotin--[acetyl-CoA-carboxylase] ligase [Rikenellaceae bacterium]|nr:biotin--[acetyl-CoA-carboxylase] ligase [Rikenellaceae bacterium]